MAAQRSATVEYFEGLAGILSSTSSGEPPNFVRKAQIAGRYGTTFHIERMPEIMEKHGVQLQ